MRKLVLFLLLFGAGLAVLLLLDRRRRPAPAVEPPPAASESEPAAPEPPVPAGSEQPSTDDGGDVQLEIAIRGAVELTSFDRVTGTKHYTFAARVEPQGGGVYEARDVVIESFDPASQELVETIRADRGRARLEWAEGARTAALGDGGRVELFDVEIVQHSGGPVVPLTLTAPRLVAELDRRLYRAEGEEPVVARGPGLEASGRGLVLDGSEGTVVLANGGRARFVTQSGAAHSFTTSAGSPLFVERVGVAGSDAFQARAPEGGELMSEGEVPTSVRARSIEVFGRPLEGAVVIERATAEGDVVAVRGTDRYEGDSARARFAASGALEGLVVERDPSWSLTLADAQGRTLVVEGDGDGPLEVDLRGPSSFVLSGESRLRSPAQDVEIQARQGMRGTLEVDGSNGRFHAEGDVRLVRGPHRLETERLDATFTAGGEEGSALDVACALETTLRGPDDTGRELIAIARGGLDFQARGQSWRVPLARDVVISSVEGEPFVATAGVVRDFDLEAGSFVAEEGVRHESSRGVGQALTARALGGERLELRGAEGSPARFDAAVARGAELSFGSFEAEAIDLSAEGAQARGAVSFLGTAQGRAYRFVSADATLHAPSVPEGELRPFSIEANGVRRASIEEEGALSSLACQRLELSGTHVPAPGEVGDVRITDVTATGDVRIDYAGAYEVGAVGQRLHVGEDGVAHLETVEGRRISAWGTLPGGGPPYELSARSLSLSREFVSAEAPDIFLAADLLPLAPNEPAAPRFTNASADVLALDTESLLLQGSVRMAGTDGAGLLATLEAENLRLSGDFRWSERGEASTTDVQHVEAWGGWHLRYGSGGDARGERLDATPERAIFDGDPARVEFLGYAIESDHFELDLQHFLLSSGRGIVRANDDRGNWFLEYASLRPVVQDGETIVVASSPVYSRGTSGARADWVVLWIDGERWARDCRKELYGSSLGDEPAEEETTPLPDEDLYPNLFRELRDERVQSYLHAAYAEGNIEVTEGALQSARGEQLYLDLDENVGALTGAEVVFAIGLGGDPQRLRTRADELLIGADGTLRARKATLTACDHDVPHYVIETGKLQLEPRENDRWVFSASHNRIRFRNGFAIPLPGTGSLVLDEDGSVEGFETGEGEIVSVQDIALSSTPRFGTAIGTRFRTEIGRIGLWIARIFGFDIDIVKGRWESEVEYLGSRGLIGTLGLRFREPREGSDDDFWLDLYVSGIPDGADDKGLIRIDEDDRDTLRLWTRGRGRYPFSDRNWIDLALSTQTDAGVQSEFFESDFVHYDQRDNFVRWRTSNGEDLFEATARTRLDPFRTDVEKLPSVGAYFGEHEIARSGSFALMYGTNVDVDRLERKQGDYFTVENGQILDDDGDILGVDEFTWNDHDIFNDHLEEVFADGLGDRDVLRINNVHRLSAPIALGLAGLRATPWLAGHLTAWNKGVDEDDQPSRAALLGGVDLATTLWRVDGGGYMSELAPVVGVRTDLAIEESGGEPVIFDAVDEPLEGTAVEAGLRARWWKARSIQRFDLELRGTKVTDVAEGVDDRSRIAVLADWRTELGGMPVGIVQDARYLIDDPGTPYSRTVFALAPRDDLVVEVGYSRGADRELHRLFEAAGLGARWRATPKWEFGLQQVLDVRGGGSLQNELEVRRFSHDFLVEISVGTRAGESGLAFSLSVSPTLGWKPSHGGLLGML